MKRRTPILGHDEEGRDYDARFERRPVELRHRLSVVAPDRSWPADFAFFTVPEVASLLRTSAKAVYAMVERRQLAGVVRIGRRVLIRRADLLDWLRQKSTPSPEE